MAHTCNTPPTPAIGDTWNCPTCNTYWRAAADPGPAVIWWRA